MNKSKAKAYLEITTNVAVLLVSVLVLAIYAYSYLAHEPEAQVQSGLHRGKPFAQLSEVNYKNSPRTLLIAMNSRCDYCDESITFYRQLSDAQREHTGTRLLIMFSDAENVVKQYVSQKQLEIEAISSVNLSALHIDTTPTMILVDNTGKILDFWIGKLSPEDEQQVIKSITGLSI